MLAGGPIRAACKRTRAAARAGLAVIGTDPRFAAGWDELFPSAISAGCCIRDGGSHLAADDQTAPLASMQALGKRSGCRLLCWSDGRQADQLVGDHAVTRLASVVNAIERRDAFEGARTARYAASTGPVQALLRA
jgi:hypothetical protein